MNLGEFKAYFYVRKSIKTGKQKRNNAPVYIRVEKKGKRKDFSTKLYGPAESWDNMLKRFTSKEPIVKRINSQLANWEDKLEAVYWELLKTKGEVELDEYYKRITGNYKTPSLVDVFEQRIEELEELVGSSYSKSTLTIYQRTLGHLKRFLERNEKKDILLRNINEGFLRRFFEHLRITMSTNSANKYMRKLNAVLNYADRNGLLENSKVVTMSLKDDKTSPVYLTEEELQTIMNKEITIQRLHRIRDVFVFMCYISFAYADVKGLKPEHIIIEDGKEYIIKPRKKTEIQASVPLLQQTKELLKKYEFMQLEDKCFPVPSSQKMNAYLQELAAICGINKHLTSHVGRHTFATMMLNKGMRPETLYRIMGLSSQKHLDIYAKMLKITLYNEMEKVLNIEQL